MPNIFNNNFGMQMNINFMPNLMMNNNINLIPNLMINNNINQEEFNPDKPIINISFKTNSDKKNTVQVKYGTTIDQLLQKYLNKIGKPELYEQKSNNIYFLFNSQTLNYGDTRPVEKIFKVQTNFVTVGCL